MLDKTLALLERIKPGTYVDPDTQIYDEEEICALGRALEKILYAPSQIRERLQDFGATVVPANYYSQIPTIKDIEAFFQGPHTAAFDYIINPPVFSAVLDRLIPYSVEFTPPNDDPNDGSFFWGNSQFSYSDAMSYYCMIRDRKPQNIVEIGSGFSTLIAMEALRANGFGSITCVEPFPRDFLVSDPTIDLVKKKVQDLDSDFFNSRLSDGDMLVIDSTHTVRLDSDCIHIYLRLLPRLQNRILIHVHDVFFPKTQGITFYRDHQLFWTEQDLLYAYLIDNYRAKPLYGSTANLLYNEEKLKIMMGGKATAGGGSFWFVQSPANGLR